MTAPRKHRAPTVRARRGLTLLELVVALAVGGAALAAGGTAFATLADRRQALLGESQREERALAARRALVAWLAETRTDADGALRVVAVAQRTVAGRRDDDTVRFVTTADGDARAVQLFIARDAAQPALVAELRRAGDAPRRITLASAVDGFAVSVLSSAFGGRRWQRGWAGGALRPEALRLHLEAVEGSALPAALHDDITVVLGAVR